MARILIVDDNREMRELLCQLFREWSYQTVSAGTLIEARTAVTAGEPFKVIVCDFELPDGNGLKFLSWLRWELRDLTPFLLISGSAEFLGYYPSDFSFLAKPFRIEELRNRVDELAGSRQESR